MEQQSDVCAICRQPETRTHKGTLRHLSVDHDHATGVVRGLLCDGCNGGLARFGDDIAKLERAIAYLQAAAKESVQKDALSPDS